MTATQRLAMTISNITAYLRGGWTIPANWVSELLVAYEDEKQSSAAWRRAYNRVSDAYRDLLAIKPEVYLVEGHDAAYWARQCTLASDVSRVLLNNNASMVTQHKALSAEYLALRTKYDRLQRVATECEDELREIRQINS